MYDLLKIKLALSICTGDNECQMAFYNVKMAIKRQIEILESFKSTFCRDCYANLDNI